MNYYKTVFSIIIFLALSLGTSYAQDFPNNPIPRPLNGDNMVPSAPLLVLPDEKQDPVKQREYLLKEINTPPVQKPKSNNAFDKVTFETPASPTAKSAPVPSDYNASERFRNSPCFGTLGYDPKLPYEIQDKKYTECENAKSKSELTKVGLVILLGVVMSIIVIVALKNKPKPTPAISDETYTVRRMVNDSRPYEYLLSHEEYGDSIHMYTTKRLDLGSNITLDMNSYEISKINRKTWLKSRT